MSKNNLEQLNLFELFDDEPVQPVKKVPEKHYEIFVDGSFLEGVIGYGAVILEDNQEIYRISGFINDPELEKHYQIAGEIEGVKQALTWCKNNKITKVTMYCDYQGLMKWDTGEFKAKSGVAIDYVAFLKSINVVRTWKWIKAHTNLSNRESVWNEVADTLAKAGSTKGKSEIAQAKSANEDKQLKLTKLGLMFTKVLVENGFTAAMDGVFNKQYARVRIKTTPQKWVNFDIYDTKNRSLENPYLSKVSDALAEKLLKLYFEFLKNFARN